MDKPPANDEIDQINRQLEEIDNQCRPVEDALQESEETYRSLGELSPDAVVILQDGRYQFINSMFTRQFGYNRKDQKPPGSKYGLKGPFKQKR